ncbi:hypothetical protein ABK040_004126 [Willaertia magna]
MRMGLLTKLKKLFKKEKEENKQSKTNARLSLNANTKVENYNSTNLESTDVAVDLTPKKARPVRSQRFEQRMSRRRTLANERYYQEEKENTKRNTIGDWNE